MKVAVLDGKHPGPITTLQFNPRYMMFASACINMVRSDTVQCTRDAATAAAAAAAATAAAAAPAQTSLHSHFEFLLVLTDILAPMC